MTHKREVLRNLHEEIIKGSLPESFVMEKSVFLCHMSLSAVKFFKFDETKVYISSRSVKHMYDKRPAQEYDRLLDCIHLLVKYPDRIYKNKDAKRGDFIFVKTLNGIRYMCSVQYDFNNENGKLHVVTAFSFKPSYLNNYELLWSWRDDIPSS